MVWGLYFAFASILAREEDLEDSGGEGRVDELKLILCYESRSGWILKIIHMGWFLGFTEGRSFCVYRLRGSKIARFVYV